MAEEKDSIAIVDSDGNEITGDDLIIKIDPPYHFEGREYKEIDLRSLRNMKGKDMLEVNKLMVQNGYQDTIKETTLPYALYAAARIAGLPFEFFENLSPNACMRVYGAVLNFLNGRG